MKKIISTLAMLSTVAVVSNADFTRVEMGVGSWSQSSKGHIQRTDSDGPLSLDGTYTSAEKDASQMYAWALIKHPIPVIPNLRLEYVTLSDEGTTTGSIDGTPVTSSPTKFDVTQYDVIPYYNLIDNTAWVTLDLGIDIKVLETKANVDSIAFSEKETVAMPMVYARTRVELPLTGLGAEADAKYITYSGNTMYDARIKVDYTLDITPVVQPGIEVGYRIQKLKVDDGSTQVDLDYSGVYAGLMLRF